MRQEDLCPAERNFFLLKACNQQHSEAGQPCPDLQLSPDSSSSTCILWATHTPYPGEVLPDVYPKSLLLQ